MPYFTIPDRCDIFYRNYGVYSSKPVVVFLNGTAPTTLYWGNHVPVFSKGYGLLFYDAGGQGQSDLGATPISLNLPVSDLKNWCLNFLIQPRNIFCLRNSVIDRAHKFIVATKTPRCKDEN